MYSSIQPVSLPLLSGHSATDPQRLSPLILPFSLPNYSLITTNLKGIDATPTGNPSVTTNFADKNDGALVDDGNDAPTMHDPFGGDKLDKIAGSDDMALPGSDDAGAEDSSPTRDRRMSKEWDASKVPPSRFQKRSGSIYSTPSSRDAHLNGTDRDKGYWEKMKEKVSSECLLPRVCCLRGGERLSFSFFPGTKGPLIYSTSGTNAVLYHRAGSRNKRRPTHLSRMTFASSTFASAF